MKVIVALFGVAGLARFTALMHSIVPLPPLAVNEAIAHLQLAPPSWMVDAAVLISTVPQTTHPGGGNSIMITSEPS